MPRIAIIDDNPDQSSSTRRSIELELMSLDSTLEVITALPFKDPNHYFDFIQRNEVCVLVLDQMLNDQKVDETGSVDYKGSQIIKELRSKLIDLPIFALTVYTTDEDLKEKYKEYDDIISRDEFYKDAGRFVPKFWRAARNYLRENIDELSRFNEITKAVSGGDQDPEIIKELQALQVKLELPFSGFENRSEWLNEYENQLKELEEINQMIKAKLPK